MLLLLPDTKFSSPYGWIDTGRASPMQRDLGPDATAQKQSSYIWLTDGIQPTGRPGTAPLIGEPKRLGPTLLGYLWVHCVKQATVCIHLTRGDFSSKLEWLKIESCMNIGVDKVCVFCKIWLVKRLKNVRSRKVTWWSCGVVRAPPFVASVHSLPAQPGKHAILSHRCRL